jgi:hypothetical protein
VVAPSSVVLVNDQERVEALIDLAITPNLAADFSMIRAIGIAPDLAAKIGPWQRETKITAGLWTVVFAKVAADADALRLILEREVIEPWIVGRRSAASMPWVDVVHGHQFRPADIKRLLGKISAARNFLVHGSPAALKSDSFKSGSAPLETAVTALDEFYESLRQPRPAIEFTASVRPALPEPPDAMQRAVALRERLQEEVRFVTSAQWAKWRGIHSNPAAALGKYKAKHRVFAVRFSKQDRYPAFQFDDDAEPLPIMHSILVDLPKPARSWPLLSWFEAKNVLLGGRKPADVIAQEPEAVLRAARHFFARDD